MSHYTKSELGKLPWQDRFQETNSPRSIENMHKISRLSLFGNSLVTGRAKNVPAGRLHSQDDRPLRSVTPDGLQFPLLLFGTLLAAIVVLNGCNGHSGQAGGSKTRTARSANPTGKGSGQSMSTTGAPLHAAKGAIPLMEKPQLSDRDRINRVLQDRSSNALSQEFVAAVRRLAKAEAEFRFDQHGTLRSVDLAGDHLRRKMPSDADSALLAWFSYLQEVRLYGQRITNASVASLAALPELRTLSLEETAIDGRGLAALAQLPRLRTLDLRGTTSLTGDAWKHLARLSDLEQLVLVRTSISNEQLAMLASLDGLRLLDLRGCEQLTENSIQYLIGLENLRDLRIGGNMASDAALRSVAALSTLESLTIEDAPVTDAGLDALIDLPLQQVHIARCLGITDGALERLGKFTRLKALSLRDTMVTGTGLEHLAKCPQLQSLNLSQSFLQEGCLDGLKQCGNLRRLELGQTPTSDTGVGIIARILHLRHLDLHECPITTEALRHLAQQRELEQLVLRGCSTIGDEAIESLGRLRNLRKLDVRQTSISAAGRDRLQRALPQCEVVW